MSATNKDIYLAAHRAAEQLATVMPNLDLKTKKLAAFSESNLDPLDFDIFEAHFDDRRQTLLTLGATPSPSAVAAAKLAESKKEPATQVA